MRDRDDSCCVTNSPSRDSPVYNVCPFFVLENIVDVLRTIHPETALFTKSVLFCILQDVKTIPDVSTLA